MFKDEKIRTRFMIGEVGGLITIFIILIQILDDLEFLKEFLLWALLAFVGGTALNLILSFIHYKLKKKKQENKELKIDDPEI